MERPKLSWLQDENQPEEAALAALAAQVDPGAAAGMSKASAPAPEGEVPAVPGMPAVPGVPGVPGAPGAPGVAPTLPGMMPGMMMPGMMPGMMMPGMMPGLLPGGVNPMMMMMQNPMMAMMMGGSGAAALAAAATEGEKKEKKVDSPIDPRVLTLCRDFGIEDRLMRKLNDVMMRRPDTFEDDIKTVRARLSKERPDIGVLITQLDRGIFVTKQNIHPDMKVLVDKYDLDDRATQRLVESMRKRRKTMQEDLKALDVRLSSAERPSGLLMTLLQGLDTTGKLPAPPKSLGLPGSYGGREPEEKKDRDRGRSRDRRRSRSRSRRRRD